MSTPQIDSLFGRLSGELILVCDAELTVRDANILARATLGERIIGRALLQIIAAMARPKGQAFVEALRGLEAEGVTATWELLLHVPKAAPLLVGLRGARLAGGGWAIMGSSESPGLSRLYQEVLLLNGELTELIRQLTREQAALTATVNRLVRSQEESHDDKHR